MKLLSVKSFTYLFLFFSFAVTAGSDDEISHLLSFVERTDCTYERNGETHSGAEAVEHIKKKYDYYFEDIKTAEEFIEYSATKSLLSGKHYLVHCPSKPTVKSKEWLLTELDNYRRSQDKDKKN